MAANPICTLLVLAALISYQVVVAFQQQQQQQQQQRQQQQATRRFEDDQEQHPAPEPYSFAYSAESNGGLSTHQERGDGNGRVTGFYTIQDSDGRERRVDYVADENGYRANVRTNEVGTRAEAAADAQYTVQLPSAKQLEAAKISYEQYKYLEDQYQVERERNQQARSKHLSMKQQAQQHAIRYNQLAVQPASGNSLTEQQVNSLSLGQQQLQQHSGQQNGLATTSAPFSSDGNLNFAVNQNNRSPSLIDTSSVQADGGLTSGQANNENHLYQDSWRQRAFDAPIVTNTTQLNQSTIIPDNKQAANVRGQFSSQAAISTGHTFIPNQPAPVNFNQADDRKSSQFVSNEQVTAGNAERVVQQDQQQQVAQEPAWKTSARLGGTTKRPITVLQRQLEQQFMQEANQLTDQDYPRQVRTTAAPQITFGSHSNDQPQQIVALNRPVEGQQRFPETAHNDHRFAINSGYGYERTNTTSSERPQVPEIWRVPEQAPYQVDLTSTGRIQAPVAENQVQANQNNVAQLQQNNIINEDTQFEDVKSDQVNIQETGGQSFIQAQQQQQALSPAVTTSSENLAINTNLTAPAGFVSVNLSDNEASRPESTERPFVSAAPIEIVSRPQQVITTPERPQFAAKQEQQEEVTVAYEQNNGLSLQQQQQQVAQQQSINNANFQEQQKTTAQQQQQQQQDQDVTNQPTFRPEPISARPNSVNQIIESITREPIELVTSLRPQKFITTEQKVNREDQEPTKTRQPAQFAGMIMRSTFGTTSTATVPAIFRQEITTTTTTASPATYLPIKQQEQTTAYQDVQSTNFERQPTTSAEPVVQVRPNKEPVNFANYGVKGGSKFAPSLPGPRRTFSRLNVTRDESRASIRTTTESSLIRQTPLLITTRLPARSSHVEFAKSPQKQVEYLPVNANQSSITYEYKQQNLRQQQPRILTTTTYPNVISVSADKRERQQQQQQQQQLQQWKGIKGGSPNGLRKQFWQAASGNENSNRDNERSVAYLASSRRSFQAPQINQSSRLMSANYDSVGSSSGFGSRVANGAASV